MTARRWVLAGTAVLVAGVAVMLVWLRWESANKVATAVSALAGLAAVGVAVWAGWPAVSAGGGRVRVRKTGAATASGTGDANTGVVGRSGAVPGDLTVDGSGDARASGEGDANSGIRLS
ncbi:hypothetical protein [Streptosporangium saharense]|uniref:hypothetical protein n=1 Tax=Streptosporangium saharense TaxID=1706840 RepID=UPI0034191CCF